MSTPPTRHAPSDPAARLVSNAPAALTAAEALDRTIAMLPAIASRAAECERLRRCPDATIAELHDAGLMRLVQPRRFGGSELPLDALMNVVIEMAKVCPSTAWVYMNVASHAWNIAAFELQAQEDVWNADPNALAASGLAFPCGRAKPVDGGYVVSGRWPFASGVDTCTWMLVGAFVEGAQPGELPERRFFLVPQADFRSLNNWDAYGLAGSGSHDVEVKDAFVPEHRSILADTLAGVVDAPGAKLYDSAMMRTAPFAFFATALALIPAAAARGAVDEYVAQMKKRAGTYTGARLSELATVQLRIADASAAADIALQTLRTDLAAICAAATAGIQPDLDSRMRWRRNASYSLTLAKRAVETVLTGSGAGALYSAAPLQRLFRDIHAAGAHFALAWDVQGPMYGQHALGLPRPPGILI